MMPVRAPPELRRILYLEDDPSVAEVAMMGLEEFGDFEVRYCGSGRDAITAAAVFRPQLCLFDVMLPDMDGVQTLREIRNTPEGRGVAAIFMTGCMPDDQQPCEATGVLGVIAKPFSPTTLVERIRTMWGARSGTV